MATQRCRWARQLVHQRLVLRGPLVLSETPLKTLSPAVDRDRTVSRRSEPNSRIALTGEQPDPWQLLHRQDATSRHRFPKFLILGKDYAFIPFLKKGRRPYWPSLFGRPSRILARSLYRTSLGSL